MAEGTMDTIGAQGQLIAEFTVERGGVFRRPVIYPRMSEDSMDRCCVQLWRLYFTDRGREMKRYSAQFKRGIPPPWWGHRHQRAIQKTIEQFGEQRRLADAERAVGGHVFKTAPFKEFH